MHLGLNMAKMATGRFLRAAIETNTTTNYVTSGQSPTREELGCFVSWA